MAAAMEAAAMEPTTVEPATVESTAMEAAAEAETDHRSADIGGAIAAIVGAVVGAIGVAGRGSAIDRRRADADKDASRSRRSDGRRGTRHQHSTKSNFCEAFRLGLLCCPLPASCSLAVEPTLKGEFLWRSAMCPECVAQAPARLGF